MKTACQALNSGSASLLNACISYLSYAESSICIGKIPQLMNLCECLKDCQKALKHVSTAQKNRAEKCSSKEDKLHSKGIQTVHNLFKLKAVLSAEATGNLT